MTESGPGSPGAVLRAEREALGVSIREVAETLNLSMTMIEAIEADDLDRLPGLVFARGYVRAYARLLDLEPEPLMAQYPKPVIDPARTGEPSEAPVWEWIRRRPGVVLGAAAGTLALILVLLVSWLWPDEPPAPPAGDVEPPSQPGPPGQFMPAPDASAAAGASAADTAVDAALDVVADAAVASAAAPPRGDFYRLSEQGDDRLTFRFASDCWVEVRRADDSNVNLYSDLRRGGSELELVGEGPFWIRLGHAPNTDLVFNGESVPLGPHTRNNIATLVLGH